MITAFIHLIFQELVYEFINSHNGLCDIWYHSVFHNTNKFIITSLYRPDIFKGFKKAEFFGAMIENSLMFQHFKKKGIRWEVEKSIMNKLGFTKHNKELRVYYAYPEGNHTKHFLNKKVDGMTLLEHFQLKALDFLGNQVFLLMDNKSSEKKLLNSISVPFNLQGLNEYQEVHNLLYLGTFNKEPTFYKFINKFLKYEMDESSYHLYQSLMRTSYRNPDDYTPVNIFIPCLSLFEPLKGYFINVDYVSLDLDHLDYYKRQDVYLTEEVYENKKNVLVELFGTKFWKEQDRIRDEFIINGYELATVMVMDKWKNVQTKELWYLAVFPDSLLDYCHKKKWKFMRTLDSNNFEQLPVVKNE